MAVKTKIKIMRDIKFRAQVEDGEIFVYGNLFKNSFCTRIIPEQAIIDENSMVDEYYLVNPNTVGQFTGLQDKNGVDIYEGDIIRRSLSGATPTIVQTVYYHKCSFVIGEGDFIKSLANFCTLEVIGSIHTSPELLNTSN